MSSISKQGFLKSQLKKLNSATCYCTEHWNGTSETEAWTARHLKVTFRKTGEEQLARQGTILSVRFFALYQAHLQQATEQDNHGKNHSGETPRYLVNNHIFDGITQRGNTMNTAGSRPPVVGSCPVSVLKGNRRCKHFRVWCSSSKAAFWHKEKATGTS